MKYKEINGKLYLVKEVDTATLADRITQLEAGIAENQAQLAKLKAIKSRLTPVKEKTKGLNTRLPLK